VHTSKRTQAGAHYIGAACCAAHCRDSRFMHLNKVTVKVVVPDIHRKHDAPALSEFVDRLVGQHQLS